MRLSRVFARVFCILALGLICSGFISAQSLVQAETLQTRLRNGISLYGQGKWREAVLELRRVQAEAPTVELRAEALFWISVSELSAGEYNEALQSMLDLEKTDPVNRRVKELAYQRGRALYYIGRYDEAIVLLSGYAESLKPEMGTVLSQAEIYRKAAALYWTGECLFSLGHLDRAEDIFRMITEEFSTSPKYEASIYRIALINQKKFEVELLGLLRWSHEESLKNNEEFRRRESSYDQAMNAYQRRIASLENSLRETSANLERLQSRIIYEEEPW